MNFIKKIFGGSNKDPIIRSIDVIYNQLKNNNIDKQEIRKIMEANLFKLLSFHKSNFEKIGLKLSDNEIKYELQINRNFFYPKDFDYLNKIFEYKNKLNENSQPTPFCFSRIQYFDFNNKKNEEILIYTSEFQINLVSKTDQIYLDGTFKCSLVDFYKLFNILAYDLYSNCVIPVFHCLLTSKTLKIYEKMFNEIKNIIKNFN